MATLMNAVALVVALAPSAVFALAAAPSAAFPRAASPSRTALLRAAADPVDLAGDGGCVLTTVRAALPAAARAYAGATATVHFRARLADGGALLHDTYADGAPLTLRLGVEPSEAVAGWELALPAMRVGEVARLRCAPAYAYGAAGAPPLVPPAATIDFDLELVALRDLQTSHNPEEVDLAERYREILDAQEARGNAERRAPEAEEADEAAARAVREEQAARTAAVAADGPAAAAVGDGAAGAAAAAAPPPAAPVPMAAGAGRRGWVEERTRIRGEHIDGYSWVEDDEAIEVTCKLPAGTTKGMLACEIALTSVRVGLKGEAPLLDGALCGRVHVDGSAWSLEPPDDPDAADGDDAGMPTLTLYLAKAPPDERLWGYVLYDPEVYEEPPDRAKVPAPGVEPSAREFGGPGVEFDA